MPWQQSLPFLLQHPVGVSLVNGQGVSGVLCGFDNQQIYLMEYLYQSQFATKHCSYDTIRNSRPSLLVPCTSARWFTKNLQKPDTLGMSGLLPAKKQNNL